MRSIAEREHLRGLERGIGDARDLLDRVDAERTVDGAADIAPVALCVMRLNVAVGRASTMWIGAISWFRPSIFTWPPPYLMLALLT